MNFKISLFVYLVVSFFLFCACTAQPKEKELLDTIEKFNTAFANSELPTLDAMVTENYVHTNGNSKAIDKTSWFNYLKSRNQEIESGMLKMEGYNMDELHIELHNQTAITTAKISTSIIKNGVITENEYRVTNIWVYEDDVWKRAAFHDTKIK
ncbi:nuclear transport factor 2 family protein [Flagellimonas sp. HMM57]|uniref:nuclear transport factor 2 family protein n=1 Tax=Flagellimonas sp. HMM57 TaxID=2905121 RepID=UPI001F309A26|nr:nuclear transport factor 2 family protein [Flagellimonas sp. HMM57]UII75449.1 nuclear transport factor 2 family protein [Flagellimonas sp. HMM57]